MDCKQLQQCIDDYLDGILPEGEQRLAESHLTGCANCQGDLNQIQALRHALRTLPIPPPSPDFSRRVLAKARSSHSQHEVQQRKRLTGGFAAALAASLVMWIGVTFFQSDSNAPGIETI